MNVLVVCLGNICRSPTAEAALREAAERADVDLRVESAGTADWNVGRPPDARMRDAAARRGLELSGTARQVRPAELEDHDLVLAMDTANLEELRAMAPADLPEDRIRLFREFDPEADGDLEVPDPYHGGPEAFDRVVAICRRTARKLVEAVAADRV